MFVVLAIKWSIWDLMHKLWTWSFQKNGWRRNNC